MTFYPVTPREMRDISLINAAALVCFSLASFAVSLALAFKEGAIFSGNAPLSPEGAALSDVGAPLAFLFALIFYALGAAALFVRSKDLNDIKNESKQVTATVRISADTTKPTVSN